MKNIKTKGIRFGFIYLILGLSSISITPLFKSNINDLLRGFLTGIGGVFTLFGTFIIIYNWNMSRPKNLKKYSEMLENAEIECNDEMKVKLRNQAGRYAHITCMIITIIAIVAVIIMNNLKVDITVFSVIIYLTIYLLIQIVIDRLYYRYLLKNY